MPSKTVRNIIVTSLAVTFFGLAMNIKYDLQSAAWAVDDLRLPQARAQLNPPQSTQNARTINHADKPKTSKQTASERKIQWVVTSSPDPNVTAAQINDALRIYQSLGLSKTGAAYLIGNFISESHLVPCGSYGDGGLALGLGQWHPNRRGDMPCGYADQLRWAYTTEMQRDTPALKSALRGDDVARIKALLFSWERWGVQGDRFEFAENIRQQIL